MWMDDRQRNSQEGKSINRDLDLEGPEGCWRERDERRGNGGGHPGGGCTPGLEAGMQGVKPSESLKNVEQSSTLWRVNSDA